MKKLSNLQKLKVLNIVIAKKLKAEWRYKRKKTMKFKREETKKHKFFINLWKLRKMWRKIKQTKLMIKFARRSQNKSCNFESILRLLVILKRHQKWHHDANLTKIKQK